MQIYSSSSTEPRSWGKRLLSLVLSTGIVSAASADMARAIVPNSPDQLASVRYRTTTVDGIKLFYREAGDPARPSILLLHGFSSSSHMFRDLLPLLSNNFHLIAPDYPGFGYSDSPPATVFEPNFANLEGVISGFVKNIGLKSFVLYVQDFGGPVGFRMATKHPQWINGLIVQNANAYIEGIAVQQSQSIKDGDTPQKTSTQVVNPQFIQYLYRAGVRDVSALSPDAWTVDIAALQNPEAKRIQAALIDDYHTNLEEYPQWHAYFKKWQPKTLIVWGKNDQAFSTQAAESYRRDLHNIELHYFDTGHFALEEDAAGIAQAIRQSFISK